MTIQGILEYFGDANVLALGGLVIGGLLGFFAQRSRFCLRAAVIEFWRRQMPAGRIVWLMLEEERLNAV